jgi:hypothetical protein
MQLACPACSKRLQIPDDRLPTDRAVRITCPACQERFSYDPHAVKSNGNGRTELHAEGLSLNPAPLRNAVTERGNSSLALICLDSAPARETCQEVLTSLGYAAHVMPNQVKALEHLRQIPYRLFVLDAAFDGTSLETNLILTFLRERPLEQRRYLFVALCAPEFTTADSMLAYSQSVNIVINHKDISLCGAVLVQHLAEHERLYRVYRELRQQLGRDA